MVDVEERYYWIPLNGVTSGSDRPPGIVPLQSWRLGQHASDDAAEDAADDALEDALEDAARFTRGM